MFDRLQISLLRRIEASHPWGPTYALGRTLLASATLLTLLLNPVDFLFRPPPGSASSIVCEGIARHGLFCQPFELELLRWSAIAGLLLVISGWRPRWTAPLHWWIAASLKVNATLVDGGESVAAILTLLVLPIALLDGRENHWHPPTSGATAPGLHARTVTWLASGLLCVQVCAIYAHAAIGKFQVEQWTNGTALYYWLEDGLFRAPQWLRWAVVPVVTSGPLATLLTWSVLLLEFVLGASLLMTSRARRTLFWAGCFMHVAILFVHGIASFSVCMLAALSIGVWPDPDRLPLANTVRALLGRLHPLRKRTPTPKEARTS